MRRSNSVRELTGLALCTALLFVLQVAMSPLPNIEPVSLLVAVYTFHYHRKTLLAIYAFALLEGLVYGFQLWWVMYLYVWTVLWAAVTLLGSRCRGRLPMAALLGAFGLCYGLLCSLVYLPFGGPSVALGWWVAGIPFDLAHGAGNFLLGLTLFPPLDRLFTRFSHSNADPGIE